LFCRNWFGSEKLIDGVDDGSDVFAVFVLFTLKILDGARQIFVGGDDLSQFHEYANDRNAHLNGVLFDRATTWLIAQKVVNGVLVVKNGALEENVLPGPAVRRQR
jgi:hypothetical protein